jgi:adenylyltransferase/sulfurtransferase
MVVGAGALGNEVVKNLLLLDVRNIILVDFDKIEYSNLTRSIFFSKKDIGKYKVNTLVKKAQLVNNNCSFIALPADVVYEVGLGYFRSSDVIICCVDNRLARLFINRYAFLFNKSWVNGSIENLMGRLEVYHRDQNCYESNLTDEEWSNIRFRLGCADVMRRNEHFGRITTTPVSASIIGSLQATEALKVVSSFDKYVRYDESLFFDLMSNSYIPIANKKPKETLSSNQALEIHDTDLTHNNTLRELILYCQYKFKENNISVITRHDIVTDALCDALHLTLKKPVPAFRLHEYFKKKYTNYNNEEIYIKSQTNRINMQSPLIKYKLIDVGVPDFDILQVVGKKNIYYVSLSKTT